MTAGQTVYLMRHGEAAWTTPDHERSLTQAGVARTQAVFRDMGGALSLLQSILCSPFQRARQTASEAEALTGLKASFHVELTPDEPPEYTLEALAPYVQDQTLIVAHQPLLGALVSLLKQGDFRDPYPFGTSEIVQLEVDAWLPGCARVIRAFQ